MQNQMSSVNNSGNRQRAEMINAVATLFDTFTRAFGHKWVRTAEDEKAREVWLRALQLYKVSPDQIKTGLAKAVAMEWPPSLGEFIHLCQPSSSSEFERVIELIGGGVTPWDEIDWPSKAAEICARRIGSQTLRFCPEHEARRRWEQEMRLILSGQVGPCIKSSSEVKPISNSGAKNAIQHISDIQI